MNSSRLRQLLTPVDMIGIAAIVAIAVAVHFGGFEPVRRARAQTAEQREQLAALNQARDSNAATIRAQKTAIDQLRADEAQTVQLESASRLNSRMAAIPELADRCAVRVREVVPKAAQPARRVNKVPITIAGEGPAPRISVFLSQLHIDFPDMEVVSFSIAGRSDGPNESAHFTLELMWYTLAGPDGSAAPAPASPPPAP